MDIFFRNGKLAKVLNAEARLNVEYGLKRARQIRLRMAVLVAAPTLADVPIQPPDRCHQLFKADRKGCFAVDVEHPFRLIFVPSDAPPRRDDGGIDLRKVTAVTILEIVDYH